MEMAALSSRIDRVKCIFKLLCFTR